MLVGLLSDTHGDLPRTHIAVSLFRTRGVQAVLHAGDVGGEDILDALAELQVPVQAVLGNTDHELPTLLPFLRIELGGKQFALLHGDNAWKLDETIRGQQFDYVITGHTHVARDERQGRTRIINPGAIHRAAHPSVAILDTETDLLAMCSLSRV